MLNRRLLLTLSLLILAPCHARAAEPALLIEYRDKAPYFSTVAGKPVGLLIDKTRAILERAGLAHTMADVPAKRILQDIQANLLPICSPGWYKLSSREQFARFSLPIHQDLPQVVLVAPRALDRVRSYSTLQQLMADPRLTLAVIDGVSYGPELDRAIADMLRPPMRQTVTPATLVRMLEFDRADYMFIDQEDLALIQSSSPTGLSAQRVDFPDAAPGLLRYLICSKSVSDTTMDRINAAIRQLDKDSSATPSRNSHR